MDALERALGGCGVDAAADRAAAAADRVAAAADGIDAAAADCWGRSLPEDVLDIIFTRYAPFRDLAGAAVSSRAWRAGAEAVRARRRTWLAARPFRWQTYNLSRSRDGDDVGQHTCDGTRLVEADTARSGDLGGNQRPVASSPRLQRGWFVG